MKFPKFNMNNSFMARVSLVLAGLVLMAAAVPAQKAPEANPSASLEQCRNGATVATANDCSVLPGNAGWTTGNAGGSNSHWKENDFLPYRMLFDNLSTSGSHIVIIGYDILKSGKHAIDYLGTNDASYAGRVFPCSGVSSTPCTGVNPAPTSVFAVPQDGVTVTNQTNPNTGLPINQQGGDFKMWGGMITNVDYVTYAGGEERQIAVTFTASVANPVLSWGGHVAWIGDWGAGNSASSVSGSPYHMRLISLDGSGGNQDRSLSADAVAPTGAAIVRKEAITPDGSNTAFTTFNFTATANFTPLTFGLVDNNPGVDSPVSKQSDPITSFGSGNSFTVTEALTSGWTLTGISCTESGISNSTPDLANRRVTLVVEAFEVVTCTFTNSQLGVTAANASISGRVSNADGMGLRGVYVTLVDVSTGQTRRGLTNNFGYYMFTDLTVGEFYIVSVSSKKYTFPVEWRSFTLTEDLADLDFVSNP